MLYNINRSDLIQLPYLLISTIEINIRFSMQLKPGIVSKHSFVLAGNHTARKPHIGQS